MSGIIKISSGTYKCRLVAWIDVSIIILKSGGISKDMKMLHLGNICVLYISLVILCSLSQLKKVLCMIIQTLATQ